MRSLLALALLASLAACSPEPSCPQTPIPERIADFRAHSCPAQFSLDEACHASKQSDLEGFFRTFRASCDASVFGTGELGIDFRADHTFVKQFPEDPQFSTKEGPGDTGLVNGTAPSDSGTWSVQPSATGITFDLVLVTQDGAKLLATILKADSCSSIIQLRTSAGLALSYTDFYPQYCE